MLDTERQYFDQNREELLKLYKFIVVRGSPVVGAFENLEDAMAAGFQADPYLEFGDALRAAELLEEAERIVAVIVAEQATREIPAQH